MESPKSPTSLLNFMEERARELYDFIAAYIESEGITKEGGITIAGWSMGSLWINALLTFGPTFSIGNFPIADYIRALTAYDAPGLTLGYPPPLNAYNPLTHPSLSPDDRIKEFPRWVSSYYAHGESPTKLELRDAMSNPPPTITKMSQEELDLHLYTPPGSPDGCDAVLVIFGVKYKIFERLRKTALFPDDKIQVSNEQTTKQTDNTRNWQSIALRWVWCDHSIWEAPHAYWCLKEELQEAQGSGKQVRRVDFIRLRGANHYLHWEEPERALLALLGKNDNGKVKL